MIFQLSLMLWLWCAQMKISLTYLIWAPYVYRLAVEFQSCLRRWSPVNCWLFLLPFDTLLYLLASFYDFFFFMAIIFGVILSFDFLDIFYYSSFIIFITVDIKSLSRNFNIWVPSGIFSMYCFYFFQDLGWLYLFYFYEFQNYFVCIDVTF